LALFVFMEKEPKFETYLFEYNFEGVTYSFQIKAASDEEAVKRVRVLSSQAVLMGTLRFTIPAIGKSTFIPRMICAVLGFFQ
jgi:hypothetical protein